MNYSRYCSRVSQGVNVNDKGYDTGFKVVQCDYVFSMQNISLLSCRKEIVQPGPSS